MKKYFVTVTFDAYIDNLRYTAFAMLVCYFFFLRLLEFTFIMKKLHGLYKKLLYNSVRIKIDNKTYPLKVA